MEVNFCCQRCGDPLKLDATFGTIDDLLLTELASPVVLLRSSTSTAQTEVPEESDEDGVRRIRTSSLQILQNDDYSMVMNSNVVNNELGSPLIETTAKLFDVLTDQSEVDHPLCGDCTDQLIDLMDKELTTTENEVKEYKKYLSEEIKQDEDISSLERKLQELQEHERSLTNEITKTERLRKSAAEKLDSLRLQEEALEKQQCDNFREYNDLRRQLMLATDENISVISQSRFATKQLELLSKVNVFNASFHIWHDGQFGTINGFRLGKLPDILVEWKEINLAWGQTVLLLNALIKALNITLDKYRLVPFGDRSFIEVSGHKSTHRLPLYHVGGLRFMHDTNFDDGMVAFLDCLSKFRDIVEKRNSNFRLPYSMANGSIRDNNSSKEYSVKYALNSEESWTKALKFMLTNLKWAVAAKFIVGD